ncbi:MAG: hypothetical protein ACLU9X_01080 [Alistipes shahii]
MRCRVRYAAVPLTLAALAGCSEGHTRRPNIIVMMTDDHTAQAMSCYGSLLVETPTSTVWRVRACSSRTATSPTPSRVPRGPASSRASTAM